jgi:carboxyl-terminal processing protease
MPQPDTTLPSEWPDHQTTDQFSQSPNPPAWRKPLGYLVVGLALIAGGFYLGNHYQLDLSQLTNPKVIKTDELGPSGSPLFSQVEYLLQSKYLRANELDEQKLMYGAISGMVAAAGDPYTSFFNPEENKEMESQLNGSYQGVGIELGYNKDKQLVVIAPLKDSPADKAGVRAGDIIARINDDNSLAMPISKAVDIIRGEAGTEVKLTLIRSGASAPIEKNITRREIKVDSLTLSYKEDPTKTAGNQDIAYIRLSRFGDTTIEEWDTAVATLQAHRATSLILDLRDNPGGYLDAAIHIGSEFFSDGEIVGQQDATGHVDKFTVDHRGKLTSIPVVVLINGGSASASEIVSGALKTRNRATIIGENSFGKGSVQQVIDTPNNTSLHVTIAKWLMPDGANIDKVGIKPDIEVGLTEEDFQHGRDPQLDRAITEVTK